MNHKQTYLDSAATALKTQEVIDAVVEYYQHYPANIFRGLYPSSIRATVAYEKARETTARFIGATNPKEVIFVRSTTEAINLVAYSWGRLNIGTNDEVVMTVMEHHSNFVPWQILAQENGAVLKVIDITDDGRLDIYGKKVKSRITQGKHIRLSSVISKKTKLVALTHVSNVLGTINPIKEIVAEVKRLNPDCLVLVDGAQAVPHMRVNVADLGCDFYVFSGHKMMGPTGIGILWGKYRLLEEMAPFNYGGSMISYVSLTETRFKDAPEKFEAGTPHIAGAIGLGAAVDYLTRRGMDAVRTHEMELTRYALSKLSHLPLLKLYGPTDTTIRAGVLSFNLFTKDGTLIHPHDVGDILARNNICVRVGHHCAMPLHTRLGVPGSVRASVYLYNSEEDIDKLIDGIKAVKKIFQ